MPESLASTEKSRIAALLDALEATTAGLSEALSESRPPLAALLDAHIRSAEAAAETDGEGGLWLGEDGEALAEFLDEARAAADALPAVETDSYPALFTALLAGRVVRPRFGRHPRLHIWGPLEARLQHADLIVLGGLNEGNWPRDPDPDPWLSRPMQVQFGLPPPERRIGLAAHDFASALAAPRVVLTRAEKSEGAPSVPSRWLSRLDAVLRAGDDHPRLETTGQWLAWQAALDRPDRPRRVSPPAPRPPIEVRPRALSVTQIESWMRDPYSIFARHILKLRPLEPLEADPAAADRGNIIHAALDRFVAAFPDALPADAEDRLREIGQTAFADALAHPVVHAFWWPRFERVADWFVAVERERRPRLAHSATERRGTLTIEAPGGPFLLSAHADRIDRLLAGGYAVLDYKTGAPPPPRELLEGHAPQLPLEAAIARAGGFEGLAAAPVESLAFWRLSGGATAGEIKEVDEDIEALASAALEGLRELVTAFDDPAVSYAAAPDAARAPRFNDYAHLARLLEWAGFPEDEATP